MKVNIRYSLSAAQPPIDHRPACLNKNSAHEGWYWQDTGELIELAYCREAAEPVCETWGMPDNDSWQATGWQGLDGWPATEHMHNMAGPIVADECHRTVGIALAGEPCDESVQCFEPYHLECRHGVCTNDLIDQGQGCTGDDDCTGGLVCYGRTFNGMSDVGQCMVDRNQGHGDGHGDDCDTDADCRDGLLCSNLNRAARWGSCYPSWMFYDSREETTFSSPQDIEIHDAPDIGIPGRTDSYHFVTGLASVPVTALASLVVEHDNPQDLRITAYVPGGPTYPWEYETVLWDGQPGNDGSTRIVLEDVELFHTGDDRVEGFWSLRIVDNKPGDRGTLVRWDVKTSSRWD
ncbi:MAG: proprotein convertase P-domain-containing protein [Pirellulaceae bacterium]|jgi:subtilisin-like proprotein convertase family protein|nr:proprotein convertase P-domain-containing protein [Pirellulaceae bacterium]